MLETFFFQHVSIVPNNTTILHLFTQNTHCKNYLCKAKLQIKQDLL